MLGRLSLGRIYLGGALPFARVIAATAALSCVATANVSGANVSRDASCQVSSSATVTASALRVCVSSSQLQSAGNVSASTFVRHAVSISFASGAGIQSALFTHHDADLSISCAASFVAIPGAAIGFVDLYADANVSALGGKVIPGVCILSADASLTGSLDKLETRAFADFVGSSSIVADMMRKPSGSTAWIHEPQSVIDSDATLINASVLKTAYSGFNGASESIAYVDTSKVFRKVRAPFSTLQAYSDLRSSATRIIAGSVLYGSSEIGASGFESASAVRKVRPIAALGCTSSISGTLNQKHISTLSIVGSGAVAQPGKALVRHSARCSFQHTALASADNVIRIKRPSASMPCTSYALGFGRITHWHNADCDISSSAELDGESRYARHWGESDLQPECLIEASALHGVWRNVDANIVSSGDIYSSARQAMFPTADLSAIGAMTGFAYANVEIPAPDERTAFLLSEQRLLYVPEENRFMELI